ncbi:MAG: indolepyruvate oxidoreductase subunit beta [Kiritimatiellae bacterium]|nr:indolepyruvate oxidoreductase subunit beta [Kiritimatiellia bacterium]
MDGTKTVNVSLVGVGGQGTLLTSDLLAKTAARAGYDVKKSEIHGMAQRGGSVISQVRFGAKVASPIIQEGTSDILVSFDKLEAVRWAHLLSEGGKAIVADTYLVPVTVSSGQQKQVEDLDGTLAKALPGAITVDAMRIAKDVVGNERTMNMVLAGALSTLTPFAPEDWHETMRESFTGSKAKLLDLNIKAFNLGREAAGAK